MMEQGMNGVHWSDDVQELFDRGAPDVVRRMHPMEGDLMDIEMGYVKVYR